MICNPVSKNHTDILQVLAYLNVRFLGPSSEFGKGQRVKMGGEGVPVIRWVTPTFVTLSGPRHRDT